MLLRLTQSFRRRLPRKTTQKIVHPRQTQMSAIRRNPDCTISSSTPSFQTIYATKSSPKTRPFICGCVTTPRRRGAFSHCVTAAGRHPMAQRIGATPHSLPSCSTSVETSSGKPFLRADDSFPRVFSDLLESRALSTWFYSQKYLHGSCNQIGTKEGNPAITQRTPSLSNKVESEAIL